MEFPIAKQAFQTGASALNSELSKVDYKIIRKYFNISNSYVLQKLSLIIVPFYYKETGLYSPDLYIPTMSLITLILFKGFLLGLSNKFHPEILGLSFTRTIFIHFAVSLLYKGASYFVDVSVDFLDILCMTGYKFFIALLSKLFGLIFIGKILSMYFFVAYFFFLSRSLKNSIIRVDSPKTHMYLLFGIVITDVIIAFLYR